ncbi:hypothetical protein [Bosea sp. BIWAKO-01]|uniref:hypothetical protein n=1 Tax=Bosea sp. BIWAKO-01 TaxID=506668 RepID=UPI00114D03DF|nr:hypothetical protein [Bosea sp. BIWAKO-01]
MSDQLIAIAPDVGRAAHYAVNLALDADTLNEQLFGVGIWLAERHIPHQAKVSMQPDRLRIRVSFSEKRQAHAFHLKFGGEIAND